MNLRSRFFAALSCAVLVAGLTGCARLQSRDELNKGVTAYKNQKFPEAIKHFQEAVRLDPTSKNAHLYLAICYMVNWVPGAETPENKKNHDLAVKTFNEILTEDPGNQLALAYMANMAYQQATTGSDAEKKAAFEDAKQWEEKRVRVNPKDSDAYYYLGVIDWSEAFPDLRSAARDEKLGQNDAPLKDKKVREELAGKYAATVDEGIDRLTKALQIDSTNPDAMTYMNLLYREKAYLEDTPEKAKDDINSAESWFDKSKDARTKLAAQPPKKQES